MTRILIILFMMTCGAALCAMYECDFILPLSATLALSAFVVFAGLFWVKLSRYSLLTRAMIVLYAMPFIHTFEYLWLKDITNRDILWGLASNPYNKSIEIVTKMAMAGSIGLLGLVTGFMSVSAVVNVGNKNAEDGKSLRTGAFLFVALVSTVLSWLNTPVDTILTAAYTQSKSPLEMMGINLNGTWLISYLFACVLLIDTFREIDPVKKKLKSSITTAVALIIIVWFQFMRGDRECIGLIFALLALYLGSERIIARKQLVRVAVIGLVVFISAQVVGIIRSDARNTNIGDVLASEGTLKAGTWSAALLTPLSVVGDFHNNKMEIKLGSTYIDYLLSIPPGVITQMIGIERPVEGTHGPAWEMRYGIGGTHAMVVPFMNFKSFGVFIVLGLYGIFIGALERFATSTDSSMIKLLYASVFIIAPFWFWYGEMYLVRAIMGFYIVWWIYKILPKHEWQGAAIKEGAL